jgi:hypothetical protein
VAALGGGSAGPAVSEFGDVFGQPIDVDDVGIEVVGELFVEFAMVLDRARYRNSSKSRRVGARSSRR